MSISLYPEASTGNGIIQNGGVDAIVIDSNQIVTMNGGVQRPLLSGTVNAGGTNPFPATGGPTAVSFTSIPSWAKRVTVAFQGVTTSGTAPICAQLGTGSTPTYVTTGYVGAFTRISNAAAVDGGNLSAQLGFSVDSGSSANSISGAYVFTNITGNIWVCTAIFSASNIGATFSTVGHVPLGAALTAVRITTSAASPTQTFAAGSMNILYE